MYKLMNSAFFPKFGKNNMPSIGRVVGFPYILVNVLIPFDDEINMYNH